MQPKPNEGPPVRAPASIPWTPMFRRRRPSENHPLSTALAQAQRAALATAASEALSAEADRIERAIKTLAIHAHELEGRVNTLEGRLADVERRATESLPLMVAAKLHVVGADVEATAVAA